MSDEKRENIDEELNCHVTLEDGSYMSCDMITEESSKSEEVEEDFEI